jgi:peptide/nickel transport system permease protein
VSTTTTPIAPLEAVAPAPPGAGRTFALGWRRFARGNALGVACLAFLLLIVLLAIFADRIVPYDPLAASYGSVRAAPSAAHLLGTDDLGRDVLSRIIVGTRITLLVAVTAVLVGDSIGFSWGLLSGYFGGRFDLLSQRLLDVLLSFPSLILALLLMVGLGAGLQTVIIAIAVTRVPTSTRVVRSMVLSIKEVAYIEAARGIGATAPRVMATHLAPQCVAPFLVVATANLGQAIFAEAALSFLGVGVPPPTPSWGNMLGGVLAQAFRPPWWLAVFPGLAVTLTILATNLLGDSVRDFIDPKLRGRID